MRRSRAFTLIELLAVLVIVMILSALVYPNYTSYVIKSRRLEAQVALLDNLQRQERYYSQHNSYLAFSAESSGDDEGRFKWWSGSSAKDSAYELSGRACPGSSLSACIELHATPGTFRVNPKFRDPECQTLTLVSTGEHRAGGTSSRCWP
jgi:type IV pilus assembly protein PilE